MADSIVQGLFGPTAQQIQQERAATGYSQDLQAVRLDPRQQANLAIRQGGRGIGSEVIAPLLGVQDPELQKAQMAQQLASQFQTTTPEGLTQYAQALAQNGAPDLAQMAMARVQDMQSKAQTMQAQGLTMKTQEAALESSQYKLAQDKRLRDALDALPENASDEEYLAVYRKFGGPDAQGAALTRSLAAKDKIALKQEAADKVNTDVANELIGSAIEGTDYVAKIRKQVNPYTVGAVGGTLAKVPMTDAAALASDLKELQSKLTMSVMAAAKAQSKTGATGFGALNMKELEVIKQNIADLDQLKLSPEKFNEKLDTINKYFIKLDQKARGVYNPAETGNNAPAATADQATRKVVKFGDMK